MQIFGFIFYADLTLCWIDVVLDALLAIAYTLFSLILKCKRLWLLNLIHSDSSERKYSCKKVIAQQWSIMHRDA